MADITEMDFFPLPASEAASLMWGWVLTMRVGE
jgi:hypothetical protein